MTPDGIAGGSSPTPAGPDQARKTDVELVRREEATRRGLQPLRSAVSRSSKEDRASDAVYLVSSAEDSQNRVVGLAYVTRLQILYAARLSCQTVMMRDAARRQAYGVWCALEIFDQLIQTYALRWGNPPLGEATPKNWRGRESRWRDGAGYPRRPVPGPRGILLHNRIRLEDVLEPFKGLNLPDEIRRTKANLEVRAFREPVSVTNSMLARTIVRELTEPSVQTPAVPYENIRSGKGGLSALVAGVRFTNREVLAVLRYYGVLAGGRRGATRSWLLRHDRLEWLLRDVTRGIRVSSIPWMSNRYYLRPTG